MIRTRTKVKVTTKGVLLEEWLNETLTQFEEEEYFIRSVQTQISYAGREGYQVMGTIVYEEYVDEDLNTIGGFTAGIDIGECMAPLESI